MDEINEAIETLKSHGCTEAALEKMILYAVRTDTSGNKQHVTVEITASGKGDDQRYHAVVSRQTGERASGNSGKTVRLALINVHWQNLD